MKGLDIQKVFQGVRLAVINDLIADLENLKMEVKKIDRNKLINKLEKLI